MARLLWASCRLDLFWAVAYTIMDGLSELPSALLASPHRLGPTESDCEKPGCQARRAFSLCQNLWPRGAASFDLPNAPEYPPPSTLYKRLRWLDNGSALRSARSIIARAIHAALKIFC